MAQQKSKRLAIILLVLSSVIAGINSPVVSYALHTIPVPLFGLLRLVIPLVLIAPFALRKQKKPISKKNLMLAAAFGLLAYFAANGLFYLGVKRSGAVNAAVIGLLEPLLMFTFSVEFMKEKFSGRILTGIVIAFVGSLLVVFGPLIITGKSSRVGGSLAGNLLLVGCVLFGVAATWLAKATLKKVDRIQFLFWSLVPAVVIFGVLSIGQWRQIPTIIATPALIRAVLFGAIGNGLIAYLFVFYALKQMKGEEYGLFEYVNPAVASIVAVIFFGETLNSILLFGVVIIFGGLYLAEARRHKGAHLHLLRGR